MQWKKDTVLLKPGNKCEIKQNGYEQQLKIYNFSAEDCDVYKCCAGKVETAATVSVKGLFSLLFVLYIYSCVSTLDEHNNGKISKTTLVLMHASKLLKTDFRDIFVHLFFFLMAPRNSNHPSSTTTLKGQEISARSYATWTKQCR